MLLLERCIKYYDFDMGYEVSNPLVSKHYYKDTFWSPNPECKGILAQWAQHNKFVKSGLEN